MFMTTRTERTWGDGRAWAQRSRKMPGEGGGERTVKRVKLREVGRQRGRVRAASLGAEKQR